MSILAMKSQGVSKEPKRKKVINSRLLLLKVFIHLAALLPVVNLYFLAFTEQLAGDPVEEVFHFTGIGAFNLLLLTLFISSVVKRFKQPLLIKVRRLLGLYAFAYAVLHLINFLVFDLQLNGYLFLSEVIQRPYITLGMIAFILLFALAVTSHSTLKRKMGKSWQSLHNFSYILVLVVAVHFYWSVKSELTSPLVYLAISCLMLLFRYKRIKVLISSLFDVKRS